MTEALARFKKEMWKADSLMYAMEFIREHEKEMKEALEKAAKQGVEAPFREFGDFVNAVMEAGLQSCQRGESHRRRSGPARDGQAAMTGVFRHFIAGFPVGTGAKRRASVT